MPSTSDEIYAFGASGDRLPLVVHDLGSSHERVDAGRHGHDALELLYFTSGSGHHELMGRRRSVGRGDVALVPPGALHDVSGVSDLQGWAIEFSPDAVRTFEQTSRPLIFWRSNPLLSRFLDAESAPEVGFFQVPPAERERWESLLARIADEVEHTRLGANEVVTASLLILLIEIARAGDDVAEVLRVRQEPVLAHAFEQIETGYSGPLSVADVAGAVGMTPEHLTTLMRQRTGRPVSAWIGERRMAQARLLLRTTDLTAEAIAHRVGFDDAAYFNRRFKLQHGVPPGAWRK